MIGRQVKSIARFDPLPSRSVAECDEYYESVHSPLIRRLFRGMPQAVQYLPSRAMAQRHGAADWRDPTQAWRFVTARFDAAVDAGGAWSTAGPVIEEDHRRFMRRLRNCVVDETIVVDRRSGQTHHDTVLIEVDAVNAESVGEAREAVSAYVGALAAAGRDGFGVRLIRLNTVVREGAAPAIDDEGQGFPVGRFLDATNKAAYIELCTDQEEWSEEFLAGTDDAHAALAACAAVATATVFRLAGLGGLDRT